VNVGGALLASAAIGMACAGAARVLVAPPPRLAGRVRPYAVASRVALGADPGRGPEPQPRRSEPSSVGGRLFGPMLGAVAHRAGRLIENRSDDALVLALHRAGERGTTPDEFRGRQVRKAAAGALVLGALGGFSGAPVAVVLVLAAAGFLWGASRARATVDAAIETRAERLRIELYTVNQLLALHIRTGAGPIQAVQRVVDRGRGVIVEELADIVAAARNGVGEADAFRRAAELTAEPAAARTFHVFATGAERGADLAGALRALSNDLRDSRREQVRKDAVRRRAAMLIPTVAILAPIMLLFIAAPIPSIVFGS
jgi:tight adherence protein C